MDETTLQMLKEIRDGLEEQKRQLQEVLDFVNELKETVTAMSSNPMLKAMGMRPPNGPTPVPFPGMPVAG